MGGHALAGLAQSGDFGITGGDGFAQLACFGLSRGGGCAERFDLDRDPAEVRLDGLQLDPEELELLAEACLLGSLGRQVLLDGQKIQFRLALGRPRRLDGPLGRRHVRGDDGQRLAEAGQTELAGSQSLLQLAHLAALGQEALGGRRATGHGTPVRENLARQRGEREGPGEFASDRLGRVQIAHDHSVRKQVYHPRFATLGCPQEIERHPLDLSLQLLGKVGQLGRQLVPHLMTPGSLARWHGAHQGRASLSGPEQVSQGLLRLGPGLDPHPLQVGTQDGLQRLFVSRSNFQDFGQRTEDTGQAPIPSRLEEEPIALFEIGELRPEFVEGSQAPALALHIRGEAGELGLQPPARLAGALSLHLGGLPAGPGRALLLQEFEATGLVGREGGLGPFALGAGLGLVQAQPFRLGGHLPAPLQERRQFVALQGELRGLVGGLSPQLLQRRHAGFDGRLGLTQLPPFLGQGRLQCRDLVLLCGRAGGAGFDFCQQAAHPVAQGGKGGFILRLSRGGGLDLLGEVAEFCFVAIDLPAKGVQRLLGVGNSLFLLQGLEAARFQVCLRGGDPGAEPGQGLLHRLQASQDSLEFFPEGGVFAEFQIQLQFRGPPIQLTVSLGLVGLALQRVPLPLHLRDDVADPQEVLFRGLDFVEGGPLLGLVFHDAGRLFDEDPAVGRPGVDDVADASLLDEGVRLAGQAGVKEQVLDVAEAAGDLVQQVLALARSVEAAGRVYLFVVGGKFALVPREGERNFGETEGLSPTVASKDEIIHPIAAQELGALFSQGPADGVGDVALAAAVWSNDRGDPGLKGKFDLVREGFETEKGDFGEVHSAASPSREGRGLPQPL